MKRKQFSDAQQKQFLDEWRASGLTGKQFADSHNFAAGNLWRWQRRHNDKASGNQFKPVDVALTEWTPS